MARQIVIIGGGTSGSVVAQSLAHATDHDVVLIEPGAMSPHDDVSQFFDVLTDFSLQKIHEVRIRPNGPLIPYVQARALGGGSAINGMLLTGDVPDYVAGLVRQPDESELGPVGRSLVACGGRTSSLWWNNGRWNPGRGAYHLVEEGRIRLISDDVERITIRGDGVVGVETTATSIAGDIVIMCAGTFVTPQILLRSGLGHHNEFIGRGLQDHPSITFAISRDTHEKSFFDTGAVLPKTTTNGDTYLITAYERASRDEEDFALVTVMLMTPRSRGWVALNENGADINFNLLADHEDVVSMREAVRGLLDTVTSSHFSRWGQIFVDDDGGSVSQLTEATESDLDVWIREHVKPVSHASSSCADAVSSRGELRGVNGVFVADASGLATVPSCTPAGPVTMEARRIAREIEGALG